MELKHGFRKSSILDAEPSTHVGHVDPSLFVWKLFLCLSVCMSLCSACASHVRLGLITGVTTGLNTQILMQIEVNHFVFGYIAFLKHCLFQIKRVWKAAI